MISGDWVGPHPNTPHSNEKAILGIGNYCQFEYAPFIGSSGIKHFVQKGWSNRYQTCISSAPN